MALEAALPLSAQLLSPFRRARLRLEVVYALKADFMDDAAEFLDAFVEPPQFLITDAIVL